MGITSKINKLIKKFYTSSKSKKAAFLTIILLVVLCTGFITKIKFNFDFESFFPKGHPDRSVFQDFKEKFDYDNDFILIAIKPEGSIFETAFLNQTALLSKELSKLKGTEQLLSPVSMVFPVKTPLGLIPIKLLHINNLEKLKKDSLRIIGNDGYEKYFFSKKLDAIQIKIKHKHFEDIVESEEYIQTLKEKIISSGFNEHYIVGRTSVQSEFIGLIKSDFGLYIILAFTFIILFLKIQYKNWTSVLVPLILIAFTILTTLGIMAMMGHSLNILTVLIPTIISFVAISDVIHFYTKLQLCYEKEMHHTDALLSTIKEIGLATFLTSLTTAIGFISLISIKVIPIQLLGIYTALGVFIAFFYTMIILPFFSKNLVPKENKGAHLWNNASMWCYKISKNYQLTILFISTGLIVICLYGLSLIKIDAYLLDDLPDNSFSKKSFEYLDKSFGGTKPWNLYFYKNDSSSIMDLNTMNELEKIETYLADIYGVNEIISPSKTIKLLNKSYNGGIPKKYKLPVDNREFDRLLEFHQKLKRQNILLKDAEDLSYGKISGFIPEWGSLETARRDDKLMEFIKNNSNGTIKYHLTGTTYLIDRSHEYLSNSLFWGLLFAFACVAIISMFLFRSFAMIVITLIPNILPVLMTSAVIGFMDIPIKLTTSIIFAVSFGIAVDDTIHFISRFKIEMKEKNLDQAIKDTFHSAGIAIFKTTVLLCLGFGVFCFSSFGASFFTGFFIVLTLIFALLVDLFLLPALLFKFYSNKKSKSI